MQYKSKKVTTYQRCCDLCGKDFKKGSKNNKLVFVYTSESYHNGSEWDSDISFDLCNKCKNDLNLTLQAARDVPSLYKSIIKLIKYGIPKYYTGYGYDSMPYKYYFKDPETINSSLEKKTEIFQK